MNVTAELINFISSKSKIRKKDITMDTEIYNSGIISSLTMLELMAHIENTFSVAILAEELTEDKFKTVGTLSEFISGKLLNRMAYTA